MSNDIELGTGWRWAGDDKLGSSSYYGRHGDYEVIFLDWQQVWDVRVRLHYSVVVYINELSPLVARLYLTMTPEEVICRLLTTYQPGETQ